MQYSIYLYDYNLINSENLNKIDYEFNKLFDDIIINKIYEEKQNYESKNIVNVDMNIQIKMK